MAVDAAEPVTYADAVASEGTLLAVLQPELAEFRKVRLQTKLLHAF